MARPRDLAAALTLVLLLCLACSPGTDTGTTNQPTATSAGTATATVGPEGFHIAVGGVQVDAPAGVADVGTPVRVEVLEQDSPDPDMTIAGVIDVILGDHEQPQQPVTISFPMPEQPSATVDYAAFRSDSGKQNYLTIPHEVIDGRAVVHTDHLSTFTLLGFNPEQMGAALMDEIQLFLGLTYPEPECAKTGGQPPELDDVYFTATGSGLGAVYLCAERPGGGDTVDMQFHSNGPVAWEITADPAAVHHKPVVQLRIGDLIATSGYRVLNNYPADRVLLTPGAKIALGADTGTLPTRYTGRVETVWGGVATGIEAMLELAGSKETWEALRRAANAQAAVECWSGTISVGMEPRIGPFLSTATTCVQRMLAQALDGYDPITLLKLGIWARVWTLLPQGFLSVLITAGANEFTVDLASIKPTRPTPQASYQVPEYCQQPERQAPIGYSEVAGKGSTLTGPVHWPGPDLQVVQMVCGAGTGPWPGVLMFYDRAGNRVDEIFLADLERLHQGGFNMDHVKADGDVLLAGYEFSFKNWGPTIEGGAVELTWDRGTGTVKITDHWPGRIPVDVQIGGKGLAVADEVNDYGMDEERWLSGMLGAPDKVENLTNCMGAGLAGKRLTWGGLELNILLDSPGLVPQAMHYIPGKVNGWRYDLDQESNRPRHQVRAAGYHLPVDVDNIRAHFSNGWETRLVTGAGGRTYFQVFTAGLADSEYSVPEVTFRVDDQGTVRAAEAGLWCER